VSIEICEENVVLFVLVARLIDFGRASLLSETIYGIPYIVAQGCMSAPGFPGFIPPVEKENVKRKPALLLRGL